MTMNEQQLFEVEIPEATESYAPVSHKQIIEQVEEQVDRFGLSIKSKNYQIGRGGQKVIGMFDLETGSDTFDYRIAFRNSYDKSMSVAFVAGTSVMICSNGMVIGETQFIRKHTGTVKEELEERIVRTVGDLDRVLGKAEKHSEQMKQIELDERQIAELCGRWFMEQEIIRSSQLNVIKQQLQKPDHTEFADPTLWSLYNHATHALKKTAPELYIEKYKKLHDFVEHEYQLVWLNDSLPSLDWVGGFYFLTQKPTTMKTFNILRGEKVTGTVTAENQQAALTKIKEQRSDFRDADSLNGNGFYLDAWYFELQEVWNGLSTLPHE